MKPRALVAEFVGTFALVFFGCGAIANGLSATAVAVTFGLVVAVMIYALGHVSGAHFNPVISLAFVLGRHLAWRRAAGYVSAQVGGAVGAALALRLTLGSSVPLGVTRPTGSATQAVVWEAILTAALVLVVTAVTTDTRAIGQAAALAIGGAVALDSLVGGPVSGASMNPARSIGPALAAGDLGYLWVYVLGPTGGAVGGALLYRFLREDSRARP